MATNKPKIQGYIEQTTFDCFEVYRQDNNFSQSHALEKILASFFSSERITEQPNSFEFNRLLLDRLDRSDDRVAEIEQRIIEINFLLSTSNLGSNLPEIASNPESDTLEITSNLSEITSNLESDTLEITSNLEGNLPEIASNLGSDTLEIASNLPEIASNLGSDTLEIASNLGSELDSSLLSESIITENIAVSLPENLSQALSESPIELNKIVICAINKETNLFYFWNGSQKGFTDSMVDAKRYKSEGMAERARLGILKDDYFSDYYSGSFELRYNTVRYFQENSQFKSKGRELAKV